MSVLEIYDDLKNIDGVETAHDLHVWAISPENIALTVHVTIKTDTNFDNQDLILNEIQEILCSTYKIHHSTIQIEKTESFHCNPVICTKINT